MKIKTYSQNNEQKIILGFFGKYTGRFLDIGANDGVTLSNTRALVDLGWAGDYVEPSPQAAQRLLGNLLEPLSEGRLSVYELAICQTNGKVTLHESGEHAPNLYGPNTSLLSTLINSETERWKNETFRKVEVSGITFPKFYELAGEPEWDFISIDAEGMDEVILYQIPIDVLNRCSMICIECQGEGRERIMNYLIDRSFVHAHLTHENVIMWKAG